MRQHLKPTIESLEGRSLLSVVALEMGHHHSKIHAEQLHREAVKAARIAEHARKDVPANTETPSSSASATSSSGSLTTSPSTPTGASPLTITNRDPEPQPPIVTSPPPTPSPTPVAPTPPGTGSPTSPLEVSLTTNQATYLPGQSVTMTFTETNESNSNVRAAIGPSIDGFTITSGDKTVWRSNSGIEPDFIVLENLAPGASITLTATWTASSVPGTYTVHNQLDPQGPSATFEIVSSSASG